MKKIILLMMTICLCTTLSGCNKQEEKKSPTANEIFLKMRKYDDFDYFITESKDFTKETDPNGTLGDKNSYISKTSWAVNKLNDDFEHDKFNGGTIEVFRNEKDAKMRSDFLKYYAKKFEETFTVFEYDEVAYTMWGTNKYVHQNGNMVISVWGKIHKDFPRHWFKEVDEILKSMKFVQEDVPSDEMVEKRMKKKYEDLDESIVLAKSEFDSGLNKEGDKIDERIKALERGTSSETIKDLFEYIEETNPVKFYDERRNGWYERLSQFIRRTSTPSSTILKYGEYKVGRDIPEGIYTVTSNISSMNMKVGYHPYYTFNDSNEKDKCVLTHTVLLNKDETFKIHHDLYKQDESVVLTFTPYGEVPPTTACD